ncbi:glycosyl transferase family 39 [Roseomonas sp. 18066]|uniref:glycosyl transferase family 39 n=1 Tax=Roseomonas sp. 18066 TaxID=2681412 RepID=UPI00135CF10D|nr:glycosyl transferase family 39 [Roseomonas sp. 18066]
MSTSTLSRALLLAAGLAVVAPALSQARDLMENTNNASATGSPFAYSMPVTRSAEAAPSLRIGNSAGPSGATAAAPAAVTQARGALPAVVGNSASAFGGPGTGPIRG